MLKGNKVESADEIMTFLKNDPKLKYFTHLLEGKDRYPLLTDSKGYN